MKSKKVFLMFVLMVFLIQVFADVQAVPQIIGVNGDFVDGSSVTLYGMGFGEKQHASPFRSSYHNPVSAMNFQETGVFDSNYWYLTGNPLVSLQHRIRRTNKNYYVQLVYNATGNWGEEGYSAGVNTILPQNKILYVAWWDYLSDGINWSNMETGAVSIKYIYFNAGGHPHDTICSMQDGNIFGDIHGGVGGDTAEEQAANLILPFGGGFYGRPISWTTHYHFPIGQWYFVEVFFNMSSSPGVHDGWYELRINNNLIWRANNIDTYDPDSENSINFDNMRFGGNYGWYGGNDTYYRYYGDLYIDDSFSRVYIGDSQDFENCTHLELQIPTSWSDNSITFTVNQGSFENDSQVYVFVVDSYNNVSEGYPITIGIQNTEPICEASGGMCYYADNHTNGNCSFTNPCNISTALRKMSAGDYLYLMNGTYNTYYQNYEKWAVINIDNFFNFKNPKPTQQNPVVIKAYPGENPVIKDDGSHHICIEIESENNIIIENLHFEGCQIRLCNNGPANSIIIRNNTFFHHPAGDNSGAVMAGGCENISILNNLIIGPGLGSQGVHLNTNGIYVGRDLPHLRILHNEISNVPIGIYYKHANSISRGDIDMEIAYNYIYNTDRSAMRINANYARIHDNLIGANNTGEGIYVNMANGVPGGDYNLITHNTIFSGGLGLSSETQEGYYPEGAYSNTLRDNIFYETISISPWEDMQLEPHMDYNLYSDPAVLHNNRYYTLAEWKEYYGQDSHSLNGTPVFIGGNTPLSVSGFALSPSSPGYRAASDGTDIGADISLVGIQIPGNNNYCGDGYCGSSDNENCSTCPQDCGSCSNSTQAVCGNGVIEEGEQCDDGNTITENCIYGQTSCIVCSSTCQNVSGLASYCGDGSCDMVYENSTTCSLDCSSQQHQCTSGADTSHDGKIEISELIDYINQWLQGNATINQVVHAIKEWKSGC